MRGLNRVTLTAIARLFDAGVDTKYIKEILGHFNLKTTERYLHVKRETLINIESPLDALYRKT